MNLELRKSFQFEAAHLLPRLPKTHKCRRLHGHSFQVDLVVAGECDPKLGWVMGETAQVWKLAARHDAGKISLPSCRNTAAEKRRQRVAQRMRPPGGKDHFGAAMISVTVGGV